MHCRLVFICHVLFIIETIIHSAAEVKQGLIDAFTPLLMASQLTSGTKDCTCMRAYLRRPFWTWLSG